MKIKRFFPAAVAAIAIALSFSACDESTPVPPVEVTQPYQFVIVATTEDGTYILQTDSLTGGVISTRSNGIEGASATAWIFFDTRYLYGLAYRQGDPAEVTPYELDAEGHLKERSATYQMPSRYTTWGSFDKYVVTALSVTQTDETPGLAFNFLDVEDQTFTEKVIPSGNFTGNGETANLSGILGVGDLFYSGICTTPSVNAGGTAGTVTAFPDSIWVGIFDKDLNCTILRDDRLSYASGRNRSSYLSGLAANEKGDVYVFSAAYDSRTTRPSGALRILAGEKRFDPNYFFDIQAQSGGYHLYRVWHIKGDYFLLQMNTETTSSAMADARRLAVVNASAKTFRWVSGLPEVDNISSFGSTPCTDGGQIAISVTPVDDYPHIYLINPETATAVKGLKVEAVSVAAVGKLTY
jgi:hypothetical protein